MRDHDTQSARLHYLALAEIIEDDCTGTDDFIWWKEMLKAVGLYIGVHVVVFTAIVILALVLIIPVLGLIALIDSFG